MVSAYGREKHVKYLRNPAESKLVGQGLIVGLICEPFVGDKFEEALRLISLANKDLFRVPLPHITFASKIPCTIDEVSTKLEKISLPPPLSLEVTGFGSVTARSFKTLYLRIKETYQLNALQGQIISQLDPSILSPIQSFDIGFHVSLYYGETDSNILEMIQEMKLQPPKTITAKNLGVIDTGNSLCSSWQLGKTIPLSGKS